MRGFFEIGVYHPKTAENIGTLLRSAYQCGASGVFTIGTRWGPNYATIAGPNAPTICADIAWATRVPAVDGGSRV